MQAQNAHSPENPGKQIEKSNLSPRAQIVHATMSAYVMDDIRNSGIVTEANKFHSGEGGDKNAFIAKCNLAQEKALERARQNGANPTEQTVIINFFTKLIEGIDNNETPPSTVA